MTITYEKAIEELFYSIYGSHPTNYHAVLYQLIAKADPSNRELLRLAYPMEVFAWEEWQASDDNVTFFKSHGLIV